jgi:hypothetical protein
MLRAYMRFGFDNSNAYWLVYCAPAADISGPRHDQVTDMSARCHALFSGAISQIQAEGRLRLASCDLATRILWSACHGLVSLSISRPRLAWESQELLLTTMVDSILSGVLIGEAPQTGAG